MTKTLPFSAVPPGAAPAETIAVACLDVDPEARILSCDRAARQFLQHNPQFCHHAEARRFHLDPPAAFDAALWAACRPQAPDSTVLLAEAPASGGQVQVNVLPFQPERIRIVLFWHAPQAATPAPRPPALTSRERSVLELAAAGLRRDRIGFELNISLPTVDLHCRNLRRKLSALTMSEAVAVALRCNLL